MKKYLITEIDYFKGSRKYVQGPDIFDKINNYYLSENEFIKNIYFKNKINKVPYLIITKNKILKENNGIKILCFGEISDPIKLNSFFFYLFNSKKSIIKSIKYNEESIKKFFILEEKKRQISFYNNNFDSFSTLEKIISMKKMMCTQIFNSEKKWVFTSLSLKNKLKLEISSIRINITNSIKNSFIVSDIYLDNYKEGEITFLGKYD